MTQRLLIDTAGNGFQNITLDTAYQKTVAPLTSGLTADYYTDGTADQVEIQQAVNALSSAGGGILYFKEGTYTLSASVTVKSNILFKGTGITTVFKCSGAIDAFASSTDVISDVAFEGLSFFGTATETPSAPKRGRTTSGSGMVCGININGSLSPLGSFPVITNVDIRNCIFKNIYTNTFPPFRLGGITGVSRVSGCTFDNTLDGGFIFDEEVIYTNNHVKMSADNGVSISRGCTKVTCVGNTFENCCYHGIWLNGYQGYSGPRYITCVGNVIRACGYSGIVLNDDTKEATVVGNTIDKQYFRGPSDQLTDSHVYGIEIDGDTDNVVTPTKFAEKMLIANNNIKGAPRAGILIRSAKNIKVDSNLFMDIGSQYLADGTTVIASSSTTNNIGIYFPTTGNLTNIELVNNTIIDSRDTNYTNWGISPFPVVGVTAYRNSMINCRNSANLSSTISGGLILSRTTVADADYTLTRADYFVSFTSLSTIRVATLPTAANATGQLYVIKDEAGNANTNNISITTTSAQTIDGASSKTINSAYGLMRVVSNGANWFTT